MKTAEAYHQGTIHWSCTHEPPEHYTPDEVAAYRAGQKDVEAEWNRRTAIEAREVHS